MSVIPLESIKNVLTLCHVNTVVYFRAGDLRIEEIGDEIGVH